MNEKVKQTFEAKAHSFCETISQWSINGERSQSTQRTFRFNDAGTGSAGFLNIDEPLYNALRSMAKPRVRVTLEPATEESVDTEDKENVSPLRCVTWLSPNYMYECNGIGTYVSQTDGKAVVEAAHAEASKPTEDAAYWRALYEKTEKKLTETLERLADVKKADEPKDDSLLCWFRLPDADGQEWWQGVCRETDRRISCTVATIARRFDDDWFELWLECGPVIDGFSSLDDAKAYAEQLEQNEHSLVLEDDC